MNNLNRILIAVAVLLFGTALIPFIDLPTETFNWQRYINAYQEPVLTTNHAIGSPGSFFTLTGSKFTPDSTGVVEANGQALGPGTLTTDDSGNFVVLIDSANADTGFYEIEVTVGQTSASVGITLADDRPTHPQEGSGAVFELTAGTAVQRILMPLVR